MVKKAIKLEHTNNSSCDGNVLSDWDNCCSDDSNVEYKLSVWHRTGRWNRRFGLNTEYPASG
jgi:hypothetical protein